MYKRNTKNHVLVSHLTCKHTVKLLYALRITFTAVCVIVLAIYIRETSRDAREYPLYSSRESRDGVSNQI